MSKYFNFVLCVVAVLVVLSIAVAQADTITQNVVVGNWLFDEQVPGTQTTGVAGELLDSSGNGHHGYAAGNPLPYYIAGNSGSAIHLTTKGTTSTMNADDDRIIVPHHNDFNLMLNDLTSYTIEADIWIDSNPKYGCIFMKRGTSGAGYAFRLNTLGTKLAFYIQDDSGYVNPDYTANTSMTKEAWHHVGVVITPDADPTKSTVTFYVDGVADGTKYLTQSWQVSTWSNNDIVNEHDVWMGDFITRGYDQFDGRLDNVTFSMTEVPEPSTVAMLACGLIGLLAYAWRKRK